MTEKNNRITCHRGKRLKPLFVRCNKIACIPEEAIHRWGDTKWTDTKGTADNLTFEVFIMRYAEVKTDRDQVSFNPISFDEMIEKENPVRVIDAFYRNA